MREFPHDRRSDADLVRDVAAGQEGALAAVWRRHSDRVRRTLLAQLGHDDAVDDLLQEVFLAFSSNADRVSQPERLRSYLMAAAVRQARQVIRNRSRRRRWLGVWADERRNDYSRPSVDGRDALRRLREILGQLPERLRESFVLRFVDGLAAHEVAELRNVSLATAKRDIGKAQQRVLLQAERDPALTEYLRSDPLRNGGTSTTSTSPTSHSQGAPMDSPATSGGTPSGETISENSPSPHSPNPNIAGQGHHHATRNDQAREPFGDES